MEPYVTHSSLLTQVESGIRRLTTLVYLSQDCRQLPSLQGNTMALLATANNWLSSDRRPAEGQIVELFGASVLPTDGGPHALAATVPACIDPSVNSQLRSHAQIGLG